MKPIPMVGLVALLALPVLGCGNSTPTQPKIQRALVTLTVPSQVVAVRSTDSRYVAEVTVPLVASEAAGVSAFIDQMALRVTDEASGASPAAPTVPARIEGTIPGGRSVEIPFRALLPGAGPYRAKVVLEAFDAGTPSGSAGSGDTNPGLQPAAGVKSRFESNEFRILPPQ